MNLRDFVCFWKVRLGSTEIFSRTIRNVPALGTRMLQRSNDSSGDHEVRPEEEHSVSLLSIL